MFLAIMTMGTMGPWPTAIVWNMVDGISDSLEARPEPLAEIDMAVRNTAFGRLVLSAGREPLRPPIPGVS